MRTKKKTFLGLAAVLLAGAIAVPVIVRSRQPSFVAEADLGDGRILRVEKISYGRDHHVGRRSVVIRMLGPWLPTSVKTFFEPPVPPNEIVSTEDELVVWVNAVKPDTKEHVDCQGIKLDFIGDDGTVYGKSQAFWFGGVKFWRVGHAFQAFPRNTRTLRLRVTTWKEGHSVEMLLPNPAFSEGEAWTGKPLPARQRVREAEIVLSGLAATTNEATYWESASPYWTSEFEIWWNGVPQTNGWDLEWTAEDRFGNRGQRLGLTEPALRFKASFHPSSTNLSGPVVLTNLPLAEIPSGSNLWWNASVPVNENTATILGLFPPGVHTFRDGEHLTNPPVKFKAVGGGAPSGWVSRSRRVTPSRQETFHGHYTDVPVIYVRASNPDSKDRLGLRLHDDQGRVFLAEPEPQGTPFGIIPFLFRMPPEAKPVRAELLFLPAFDAEFLVAAGGSRERAEKSQR